MPMQTLHWVALILGLAGVALIIMGIFQQRAAATNPELVGGFGGPPGTSDVGVRDGFPEPDPHAHFPVGRTARLVGLGLVVVALALVAYSWLA